jgi:hypothetical protein
MDDALEIIKDNIEIKNESKQAIIAFRKENLCNQAIFSNKVTIRTIRRI